MDLDDLRIPPNRQGYVYLITVTRPTDQREFYYVGQHLGKKLSRKYLGSGLRLNNFYAKYGRKGHIEILNWCYSQEELNFVETFNICTAKLEYGRDCLNLMHGGANGRAHKSTRMRMSLAALSRPPRSQESRDKQGARIRGRPQTKEHVAKRMAAHLGSVRSDVTRARLSYAHQFRQPDSEETRLLKSSSQLGRKMSPESSAKKSASLMGRIHEEVTCQHCGKIGAKPGLVRWHFDNCRHNPQRT